MKLPRSCSALSLWLLSIWMLLASTATARTLYVAPDGKDTWSGKHAKPLKTGRDGPLASLTGARDRIRTLKAKKPLDEPVTVVIKNGTYSIEAPLVLSPQDSGTTLYPISYVAATDTHPVISGGRAITNWRPEADGVWSADVQGVKDGAWYFEQLWVNGRRAIRARASNEALVYVRGVNEEPLTNGRYRQTISVRPEDVQLLSGLTPAELSDVNFVALHKWQVTRRRIESIDTAVGTIKVSGPQMWSGSPITRGTPYYLENIGAALDTAGEWFLCRSGRIYYRPLPAEDMGTAEIVAPVAYAFLVLDGNPLTTGYVENLSFSGLSFQYAQQLTPPTGVNPAQAAANIGASILALGARSVQFDNCEIAHIGNYALMFARGSRNSTISHSYLHDLGAGGVRVGDFRLPGSDSVFTREITVENNIIRGGGRLFHSAVGVLVGQSSDNLVTHNEIADFFYTGISVGWTWGYGYSAAVRNEISFNHIHHIGWRMLSDMGGIYTLGVSPGTTINNNIVHDVYAYNYGGWGIYLDEGSSKIEVEDNLVYNTMNAGLHLHYGQDNMVRNNIFADGLLMQLQRTRIGPGRSLSFVNNIVFWTNRQLPVSWPNGQLFGGAWGAEDIWMEQNLYYDTARLPITFMGLDFSIWQAIGRDSGSMIEDPRFVAPESANFRLQYDSPALTMGFQPFDQSLAGVYGDSAWRTLAQSETFAAVEVPPATATLKHLH
jgi:parallel beta-helix repeat protein